MKKERRKSHNIFAVALKHSDPLSKGLIVLLCLISLVVAASNVMVPLIQKRLLETLDRQNHQYLTLFAIVAGVGCAFLLFEHFINASIFLRFRHELERAMGHSLAMKEQKIIREEGVGVYAASIIGESEQLAKVLAASWFSILFNFIGAMISIVLSAMWEMYFVVIVGIAYALILLVILIFNKASVYFFRKEKTVSYIYSARVREMVDTHRAVFSYGSFTDYEEEVDKVARLRDKYAYKSEQCLAAPTALIRFFQMAALVAFFAFAVYDLSNTPEAERLEKYPIIIALVGFFETIFMPTTSLNQTYNLASKFRAFYDAYRETVFHRGLGELPASLDMELRSVSHIQDGVLVFANIDLKLDRIYGIHGLSGEERNLFGAYLRGEASPSDGDITLGRTPVSQIEKYLRLGLITFNSRLNEIYGKGLRYNVTLGKALLDDEEYQTLLNCHDQQLRQFFHGLDQGDLFSKKVNAPMVAEVLGDFFAVDSRYYASKKVQNAIVSMFQAITDREKFITSVGRSVFAKKYALRSRYHRIVDALGLHDLEDRDFGASGRNLTLGERALVCLARFLLPVSDNPFILVDPFENLPIESYNEVVATIKAMTKGRAGIILSHDPEVVADLADEIVMMSHGHIVGKGSHPSLIRSNKEYKKLFAKKNYKATDSESVK